jgi:hypothetical protein
MKVKTKIHKTTILPVAVYGCKIWFLTMRGKQTEGVLEQAAVKRHSETRAQQVESKQLVYTLTTMFYAEHLLQRSAVGRRWQSDTNPAQLLKYGN